ncbi:hypothetical protein HPB48_008857 [Haemaphysalis longicornis]|uniref:C2H2-type domain-containing protein n=1 Tax=Haemaphysalis longicornis TaxID=44386 RepID=A0A9J6H148_HAELO|nr:hypothetical protein HPB48_008857 [Haemaphysalis longicornis]
MNGAHEQRAAVRRTRTVATRAAVRTADKDVQCQYYHGFEDVVWKGLVFSTSSVGCQTDTTVSEVEIDLAKMGASCEMCCKFFFKKESADRHWRIQHSMEPPGGPQELYCCPYCAFSTYSRKYAQDHEGIHVEQAFTLRLSPARGCPQDCSLVLYAVEPSHEISNFCRFCRKYFATEQERNSHERRHARRVTYTCDLCPQRFTNKSKLHLHRKSHTSPLLYTCKVCQRSFSRKEHLGCHERRQACKKPVECTICQQSFSCKGDLLAHAEIHKKEKPFECDVCHRRFPHPGHLLTHKKTHEQKAVTNTYVCNLVNPIVNLFSNNVPPKQSTQTCPTARKKLPTELGVQAYSCGTCQESFSRKEVLEEHVRNTHAGISETPLVCIVCHKTFPHKMGLLSHHCTLITTRMIASSTQNASLDKLP